MTHQKLEYEEIIRSAGGRVTPQRVLILDAICQGGGHTTIGEIYAYTRRLDPTIDRSTIYRALDLFVSLGLVVSADLGTGETYYEVARPEPHHHLVCSQCGAITEIPHDTVKMLFRIIEQQHGFAAHMDHLVLPGLCSSCQAAASDYPGKDKNVSEARCPDG